MDDGGAVRQINPWTGTPGSGIVQVRLPRNRVREALTRLCVAFAMEEDTFLDKFSSKKLEEISKDAALVAGNH